MASETRLACAFVELAGKSKRDTASRKLRLIPCAIREPITGKIVD
jgi:hypothetical protein